ncbi:MAG: hypothetical protein E7374_02800 [Clostridiales bacterium]|nr:hypothetical protein [Clostridiales bacterium]
MFNLIRKFRQIPESKKIIVYGKLAFLRNLCFFAFKIAVGIWFESWFLIAIALYGLSIGYVKNNCSTGLRKNKDNLKDINSYIHGGIVLTISSVFYIGYSISQIFFQQNYQYNLVIAITIAAYSAYSITKSLCGVIRSKGKTMLIKEYKLTNFAGAFNHIVLAQVALLSVMETEKNMALFNGVLAISVGFIIMVIGIYLIVDGVKKKKKYKEIISRHPEIVKYLNEDEND